MFVLRSLQRKRFLIFHDKKICIFSSKQNFRDWGFGSSNPRVLKPQLQLRFQRKNGTWADDQETTQKEESEKAETVDALQNCWNCGFRNTCSRAEFFCGCGAIQPLQDFNYFEILKCPVHFDVDMNYLEKNYWSLQKQLHPDKYSTKQKIEQELSAQNSSHVNHAYQILKDPVERVKYLLSLYGVTALEEDGQSRDVEPAFLVEVMETREALEDASTLEEARMILEENCFKIECCLKNIKALFDAKELAKIAQEAIRLQYFTRINDEANKRLDKLEGFEK